ncbi:hypothetical protein AVEN_52745-1, partial [Araneus ventricosus]
RPVGASGSAGGADDLELRASIVEAPSQPQGAQSQALHLLLDVDAPHALWRARNSPKECYDAILQLTKGASLAKDWLNSRGQKNARNQSPELDRRDSDFQSSSIIRSRSHLPSFSPSSLLKP